MHVGKRILACVTLCTLLVSCGGNVSVSGYFDSGAAGTSIAGGTVSIVHLTFAHDSQGSSVTVTTVTLLQNWSAQELTFCGSHASEFPINAAVTVNYTTGNTCSNLISVKITR